MTTFQTRILDDRIKDMIPQYTTPGSAAIDLRACVHEHTTIQPGEVKLIPTGISIFIEDPKICGLIVPRSGLGHKHGIILGNSTGLIDSDYQGELMVSCLNRSQVAFTISPMDRIAQILFVPVIQVTLQIVDEFTKTDRGESGFGSTGVQ